MRKKWMLVSSFAVSTAIVLAPTVFAAANHSDSNSSTTQQTTATTNYSNMMNENGGSNMMNNDATTKMMNALGSPEGQKMVNGCSNFMSSYSKSK